MSKKIIIKKKDILYFVEGNVKNKEENLNQEILSVFFKNILNLLNIDKAQFLSQTDFSFTLNNKINIKNLKLSSKIRISELKYLYKSDYLKKYLPDYKNEIYFKDNHIELEYKKDNLNISIANNYIINDLSNNLNFDISKQNDFYKFNFNFDLEKNDILINEINYYKKKIKKQI